MRKFLFLVLITMVTSVFSCRPGVGHAGKHVISIAKTCCNLTSTVRATTCSGGAESSQPEPTAIYPAFLWDGKLLLY